jgi:hypothetical protein
MPKVRPPLTQPSELHKVLRGIHRLEERLIALEGRLVPGAVVVRNDSASPARRLPWARPLTARNKEAAR